MEPILKSHFSKFKNSFEIDTTDSNVVQQQKNESETFERFVNYVIFSMDYPEIFTGDTDLLDFVCVGGGHDTGIDGIGIKVNERLVRSVEEIEEIVNASKKVNIDFVFIQSKMKPNFETAEFNTFGIGVKHFLSDVILPENERVHELRKLKDYIYNNEKVISKLNSNPNLFLYYVGIGIQPTDEHFIGTKQIIENEFVNGDFYFETVNVKIIDGKTLVGFCKELENNFSIQMNIKDIVPLIVNSNEKVKKAYTFTCGAQEFLKILTKDDDTLRRSLFNDNVRDYLGNKGSVNSEIEKTIENCPELFLLCNNGVTIVCTDFEQVRDKLVKIENPQIVNGCQTSNSVFNLRSNPNIKNVQLLVKLICTDDIDISNRIVRGTNKQNQVLDEAFEATKPFHQDLEEYFLAISGEPKLYYERRAKQYNNNLLIKKTQIVNLRIITQVFVGMFLNLPHESHRHEAKLLQEYCAEKGLIYNTEHDFYPYYLCGTTWYMFDKYFRENKIPKKYRAFKSHLFLLFKNSLGIYAPKFLKSKSITTYCEKLRKILEEPTFGEHIANILPIFDQATSEWVKKGNSYHGIKDRKEFTELLQELSRKLLLGDQYPQQNNNEDNLQRGTIFSIRIADGKWYGFIKQGNQLDNLYFDDRGFKGGVAQLQPHIKVEYKSNTKKNGKLFATDVKLIS